MTIPSTTAARPGDGRYGRFEIRVAERRLLVDGEAVALGSRAFDLLAALAARRERVVAKDELMDVVWPGLVVEDNNLQVQVSALRKVLGAQAIATVPGRGYQFTVAAEGAATAAASANVSAAASAVASLPRAAALPSGSRVARLLVADDNKVNRLLLCRSLELMGHEVTSADNGRIALDKLRAEPFDLLLLDLEMPEVDGFALLEARAVDAALSDVPVIVTSSLEGAAPVARCIELGADDFLHKPVNPMLLKARVDSSLERKRLRDRQRELLARLAPASARGSAPGGDATAARHADATVLAAQLLPSHLDAAGAAPLAAETFELLNDWTTLMVDAIESHGGAVHRIAGDGVGAVFAAADAMRDATGAAQAAARAATEMVALVELFNAERAAVGKTAIAVGIGVAGGEVVAGHAGTPRRLAWVAVGAPVSRAAELAAEAVQSRVPTLVDATTRAALGDVAPIERFESKPSAGASSRQAAPPVFVLRAAAEPR